METKNLTIFVDTVRLGSFAAVARERNVDPATISRAIVTLEEELQLRLFQRSTRRIDLTEAGKAYFERVEPLVQELQQAQQAASDLSATPKGALAADMMDTSG